MFEKIQDYFRDKYIASTLKKISSDLFTGDYNFDEILAKYDRKTKYLDRLLTYVILIIATERTPGTKDEKKYAILLLYYKKLQEAIYKYSFKSVLEMIQLEAELEFKKINNSWSLDKENLKHTNIQLTRVH
jgi:hypothetical protein